jgi:hypothetical protein
MFGYEASEAATVSALLTAGFSLSIGEEPQTFEPGLRQPANRNT